VVRKDFEEETADRTELSDDWKELVKAQQGTIETLQMLVEKLAGVVQDLAHASASKEEEHE
jgi:hypothetical protein